MANTKGPIEEAEKPDQNLRPNGQGVELQRDLVVSADVGDVVMYTHSNVHEDSPPGW